VDAMLELYHWLVYRGGDADRAYNMQLQHILDVDYRKLQVFICSNLDQCINSTDSSSGAVASFSLLV
jgi:hypothetical protein